MKSTLTDQNFPNVSDESMDVDPNYDPSDFLAMHKPRQNLGEPSSLQGVFTNFLSHAQDDSGPYNAPEASTSAASGMGMSFPSQEDDSLALQMPSEMPTNTMNNGMGIDDDLDISESDEEDDGSRVRIKKEVFDDGDYALQHHQQMGQQSQSQSQIYLVDSSNEPTTLDYQQPPQLDFQQGMEQLQHQVMQQQMPPLQPEQLQQQQTPQGDNDYAWTF